MATVRKPSSLAARKMRMAISLRLAASSLRIGFTLLIIGRRGLPKFYIVRSRRTRREPFFRCTKCTGVMSRLARLQFEGAALPRREREVAAAHCWQKRKWHGVSIRLEDKGGPSQIPSLAKRPGPRLAAHAGTHRDQRRRCGLELQQLRLYSGPGLGLALGGIRGMRIGVKAQKLRFRIRSEVRKICLRKLVEQRGVCLVVQAVLSGPGALSHVKIVILQCERPLACLVQRLAIAAERRIEAGLEHMFGLGCGRAELEDLQRAELRNQPVEKREKDLAGCGLFVILAPLAFVVRPR